MRLPTKPVLAFLCLLPLAGVQAEVLVIDAVQQSAGVERPRAGMSMDQVRARFGEPQTVMPAVGDPPITRWVYPDFTVYFEYDKVIHAVVNRPAR